MRHVLGYSLGALIGLVLVWAVLRDISPDDTINEVWRKVRGR